LERNDLLEVLNCELGVRPEAPGPDELARWFRSVRREGHTVEFEFDPEAAVAVQAFAAAEQVCCADLQWDVELLAGAIRLRVTGTPAQADVLSGLWT
jgi:hypothetical protein